MNNCRTTWAALFAVLALPMASLSAATLTSVQIAPGTPLPVEIPAGSVTSTGPDSFNVSGPGLVAFPAAANEYQPGDVQEFYYEEVTGDFDKSVKLTALTSGPVTDPVDAQASAGLEVRVSTDALSPSFLINASNPLGANQVQVLGRAIEGQNYTVFSRAYPGVDKTLPNQWLRIRRVGDWFSAYVGTDGTTWALVGQRYAQMPAKLLVGTYSFSASYVVTEGVGSGGTNLAVGSFSNYGDTAVVDSIAPRLVSVGTLDKKTIGVKFSEAVGSATALTSGNYTLSQGTVSSVRPGINGDSVYLSVSGLTSDSFTVTVNNVKDTAGNTIAANSSAPGKAANWSSADIGYIQDPANRPTPGDDPYRVGQAVAISSGDTETEIDIVGGGSNAWNAGDYVHYLSNGTPLTGDFDVMVEVSRNDRPANTAGWANSGLMLRESLYLPGGEFTSDGTKVPMVANTTYIEASAPNRAGIPLWREEDNGGYGNGNAGFAWTTPINGIKGYYLDERATDAAGTPDSESSPLSSRWLRVTRTGNNFMFYVSYDGKEWAALDEAPKELPLGNQLLFGFSTMNDTGSAVPPDNAYAGNGDTGTALEGKQNASNYSVQRIRIGTKVSPRPIDLPLKTAAIKPDATLPVVIPAGSVTFNGPDSFTIAGPGLVAFPSASNEYQPGDIQEFAYETITGDFDKIVKIGSITSGPVTDPVDAQASGGLEVRLSTGALSPSFLVNASNPLGANQVQVLGRAIEGQNYTVYGRAYPGVDKTLPNQWLRLRRVGDYFSAYVGTDGVTWSLIGQRYQQWPATLLVGAYAFSASYVVTEGVGSGGENLATVQFSNYGNAALNDTQPPTLVSVGTLDKKVVGVKFSEPVASATALNPANYTLSQGTVSQVQSGIGGDTVYLMVTGLTSETFTVTVNNVTDTAGNSIAANSAAAGKVSNWSSADVGFIQDAANRPTPGDDPYRVGQAVAVSSGDTETEIEIVGGGSNAWNAGDYIHYLSNATPLNGDFDVMVEVSRNDRPANTAGWANSGLMLRESLYLPGGEFTIDGTKVPMVANTTYIEASAPNRAGIPLWREEDNGGYGNGNAGFAWTTPINGIKGYYLDERATDAAGTPDPESSPLSSRWLRVTRTGNGFMFYVSYDGKEWAALDEAPKELPLSSQLLFGFSTMNDTGSAVPPDNAYAGNGETGTDLEGKQNASNYSVQRIRIGTKVAPRPDGAVPTISIQGSQIFFTGKLQGTSDLKTAFSDVLNATSPYTVPAGTTIQFYRASN